MGHIVSTTLKSNVIVSGRLEEVNREHSKTEE